MYINETVQFQFIYRRNEEVDEKSLVKKLRKRVAELETELACLLMEKVRLN